MQAFFPVTYDFGNNPSDGCGGQPVSDAGAVYLWREESCADDWPSDDAPEVAARTSLKAMIDDAIDVCGGPDGKIAEDHITSFLRLRHALLEAVAQIDAAMITAQPAQPTPATPDTGE